MFYFFFCLNLFGRFCPGTMAREKMSFSWSSKNIKKLVKLNKIVIFQLIWDSGEFFGPLFLSSLKLGVLPDVLWRKLLCEHSTGHLFAKRIKLHTQKIPSLKSNLSSVESTFEHFTMCVTGLPGRVLVCFQFANLKLFHKLFMCEMSFFS